MSILLHLCNVNLSFFSLNIPFHYICHWCWCCFSSYFAHDGQDKNSLSFGRNEIKMKIKPELKLDWIMRFAKHYLGANETKMRWDNKGVEKLWTNIQNNEFGTPTVYLLRFDRSMSCGYVYRLDNLTLCNLSPALLYYLLACTTNTNYA